MHIKTKRYSQLFLTLLFTASFLNTRAESSITSCARGLKPYFFVLTAPLIGIASNALVNYFKEHLFYRQYLAPEFVQDKAIKTYKKMEFLCQKHPIIGQFAINIDKVSKCPKIYHNVTMEEEKQAGYSEPPGTAIYISSQLTRKNLIDSVEEGVIEHEVAHCVLGHTNPFTGFIIGLIKGSNQVEFEAETLTVFNMLKEEKFETLKKYLLKSSEGSSNVFSIDYSSEIVCYKIGQVNGIAAFRKEFPDHQLVKKIIGSITKDASTQKLIENFQFTNSYKKAKTQLGTSFTNQT